VFGLLLVAAFGSVATAHPDHQQIGQQAQQHDHEHSEKR
jgi:hypothetical protein